MADMYDADPYGAGAPASGAAAGVGYALRAAQGVKDYLTKRKSGKTASGRSSPDTSAGPSPDPNAYRMALPSTYKRGGLVRRTGWAKVHKNERVLTAAQAKKHRKRSRGTRR